MKPLPVLALLPLALCGTIPAQAFEHKPTGFGLTLSDDFVIDENIRQTPEYTILVGVRSAADEAGEPNLCIVGLLESEINAGLTQKEINTIAATAEFGAQVRASLSSVMTIDDIKQASAAGIHGVEVFARPRLTPEAENIRAVLTLLDIPTGRVSVSCVATAETLDAMLPTFRTIRDGIVAPR